jgi:hypothetical protein
MRDLQAVPKAQANLRFMVVSYAIPFSLSSYLVHIIRFQSAQRSGQAAGTQEVHQVSSQLQRVDRLIQVLNIS